MTVIDRTEPKLYLNRLIAPRSVAVVGASRDESGHSGRTMANLRRTGYTGRVLPVNPKWDQIGGVPCYSTVAELPGDIDVAYISVRADRTGGLVAECAERGIANIVVCSSGFAELGEAGRDAQVAMVRAARRYGSRLLGPNCIGVMNVADNVVACPTFNITYDLVPGTITILSQSGGMAVTIGNRAQARGTGVRALLSLGNEADLDVATLVEAFVDDPQTQVIALVLEQVRDGARFAAAARRARAAGCPIVALKLGRSDAGIRSALGHTGALAGDYPVLHDVLAQLGVVEVESVDELIDTAHALQTLPPAGGNRLAVLSPSGGECTYVADRASAAGLTLPDLSPHTKSELGPLMPLGLPTNPLDPTGAVIGDPQLLRSALTALVADEAFDLIQFAIPTWSEYDAQQLLPAFIETARSAAKPVVVSAWAAGAMTGSAQRLLRESGVVHAESADAGSLLLANLYRYHATRPPTVDPAPPGAPIPPRGLLDGEHAAKQLLSEYGIPVAAEVAEPARERVLAAAAALGWPRVAKLQCRGVHHKSQYGLVEVGLRTPDELSEALGRLAANAEQHGLEPEHFLVAEQAEGLEVIVGALQHPTFGPLVMVGAGGVHTELLGDRVFRLAPVTAAEVERVLDGTTTGRILRGARGRRYDRAALARLVARLSELVVAASWITEIDLNPVLVSEHGVQVVDAVIASDG